jgi:hypothetical protein
MDLLHAKITCVGSNVDIWTKTDLRFLKEPKVMYFPFRISGTNNVCCFFINNNLRFYSMTFFLAGVEQPLFFLGR